MLIGKKKTYTPLHKLPGCLCSKGCRVLTSGSPARTSQRQSRTVVGQEEDWRHGVALCPVHFTHRMHGVRLGLKLLNSGCLLQIEPGTLLSLPGAKYVPRSREPLKPPRVPHFQTPRPQPEYKKTKPACLKDSGGRRDHLVPKTLKHRKFNH